MIYRIGTIADLANTSLIIPLEVSQKLTECIAILDDAYGANRDYFRTGGYALLIDDIADVSALQAIIDFESIPCEWIIRLRNYLCALYLLGDDFSIVVCMPIAIAPIAIKKQLQGEIL